MNTMKKKLLVIGDCLLQRVPEAIVYPTIKVAELARQYNDFIFQGPVVYCVGLNDLRSNQHLIWQDLFEMYNLLPRSPYGTFLVIPPLQTSTFDHYALTNDVLSLDFSLIFWSDFSCEPEKGEDFLPTYEASLSLLKVIQTEVDASCF